ncbi:hypothetical protein [Nesterenkonia flava]|uniref:Uncharacterized protein n=1 Tax=Nesterenkonia flava TaxID=469799 RepID=A0ABU1FTW1_9MICC|nr:hypothetical protein [Nesterenkonia flava]MDR5712043.1 hypothetical protein [Nesterenkonia flava]
MTAADLFIIAVLATVLVIGAASGLRMLLEYLRQHFSPEAPAPTESEVVVEDSLDWIQHRRPRPEVPVMTSKQRLVAEYLAAKAEQDKIHRQTRMAMHEAAGQGWRNVAE